MIPTTITYMKLSDLKPHPRHDEFLDNLEGKHWDKFVSSIKENGVLFNILVTQDGVIVDGYERFKACKELGYTDIPCIVKYYNFEDDILNDMFALNIPINRHKYNGSASKMGKIIKEMERIYGVKAKPRRTAK